MMRHKDRQHSRQANKIVAETALKVTDMLKFWTKSI
jgi:hypothetical protein